MCNRAAIQRIVGRDRAIPTLRLITSKKPHLLVSQHGCIWGNIRLAVEDDRAVVCGSHDRVFGMDPIGWDHSEDLVDFENALWAGLEVRELLVSPVQVHFNRGPPIVEWIE